jgi:hypothetical protein
MVAGTIEPIPDIEPDFFSQAQAKLRDFLEGIQQWIYRPFL